MSADLVEQVYRECSSINGSSWVDRGACVRFVQSLMDYHKGNTTRVKKYLDTKPYLYAYKFIDKR